LLSRLRDGKEDAILFRARFIICVVASAVGLASILSPVRAQAPAVGAEGTWRGTLIAGTTSLRLVLRISKAPDGLLTGALDSLDQGSTIPVDSVTQSGDAVRVVMAAVGAVFAGTLNANRTELKGTFTQGGPLPLTFTRDTTTAPTPATTAQAAPTITAAMFPLGLPFDLNVPSPPMPFLGGDGKTYLVYELHITNLGGRDLLLKRLDVVSGAAAIAAYEDTALNGLLVQAGVPSTTDRRTIGAGRRAVAFLWLAFDAASDVPATLSHRVTVGEINVNGGIVAVSPQKPIVIGAPLRGAGWMALNGPGPSSGHRRALIPTEGGARIAQRFAIDWLQIGPDGQRLTGDPKDNKSYRAYGADLLAVADATVVAIKDGVPENVPGPTSRAVAMTSETIGGNYVMLDLGGGMFAYYAHLQPGSLRVKAGDRVTRGQVLGLLGNSGNSTEPHLHFQVSQGASPLGSEGVPYAIAGMTGLPLQNARVDFGG
jgi:hypothetical protein